MATESKTYNDMIPELAETLTAVLAIQRHDWDYTAMAGKGVIISIDHRRRGLPGAYFMDIARMPGTDTLAVLKDAIHDYDPARKLVVIVKFPEMCSVVILYWTENRGVAYFPTRKSVFAFPLIDVSVYTGGVLLEFADVLAVAHELMQSVNERKECHRDGGMAVISMKNWRHDIATESSTFGLHFMPAKEFSEIKRDEITEKLFASPETGMIIAIMDLSETCNVVVMRIPYDGSITEVYFPSIGIVLPLLTIASDPAEKSALKKANRCFNPACPNRTSTEASHTKVRRCGRCKKAAYCSRECQKADYAAHKPGCIPIVDASDAATAVGATAVGATAVGATAVGATAVGATAVGATAVGATAVGAADSVGAAVGDATAVDAAAELD